MADEVAYAILRSIRRIVHRVSSHSKALSRDTGLTLPQLLVMRAVANLGPQQASMSAIGARVHLSPSTLSGVVERLVKAGLLVRERGTLDRRKVHMTITHAGLAKLETMPPPLQERFTERLLALDDAERSQILSALERVVELMDAESYPAAPVLSAELDLRRE